MFISRETVIIGKITVRYFTGRYDFIDEKKQNTFVLTELIDEDKLG